MATIKIKRRGRFGGQKISRSTIVDSTSLTDLLIAIETYGITILPVSHQLGLEIAGQGLSGHIHQATADVETMLVFKKGVTNRREFDDDQEQDWYHLITQIAILQHKGICKSKHIIDLLGITFSVDRVGSFEMAWPLLITRKATLGHLGSSLSNTESPISTENRRKFFTEVAEAVLTLHHYDIKPENFVVDQQGDEETCQLIDFGSCVIKEQKRFPTSSPPWNPPELANTAIPTLTGFEFISQADLFSLALVLIHILVPSGSLRSSKALFLRIYATDQEWEQTCLELDQAKQQDSPSSLVFRFSQAIQNANLPDNEKAVLCNIVNSAILPPNGSRWMPWQEIFHLKHNMGSELKSLLEGKPSDVVELPRRIFDTPSDAHEKHKIFELKGMLGELDDTDFAVRHTVLRAVERKARSSACHECRKDYSFQAAICHEIQFGAPPVSSQGLENLEASGRTKSDLSNAISNISEEYKGTNHVPEKVLEQLFLPVVQSSNRPIEYQRHQRLPAATKALRTEIDARTRILGPRDRCSARLMEELAQVVLTQGMWAEAADYQQKAIDALESYGRTHPSFLAAKLRLADIWFEQGLYRQAEREQRNCISQLKPVVGDRHPDVVAASMSLAKTLSLQGAHGEAESIAQEVISSRSSILSPTHPLTINAELNMVVILINAGHTRKITNVMSTIERKLSNALRTDTIRKAEFGMTQAIVYREIWQLDLALEKVKTVHACLARQHIDEKDDLRLSVYRLEATIHHASQQWAQEESLLRKAIDFSGTNLGEVVQESQYLLVANLILQGRLLEALDIVEAIKPDVEQPMTTDPDACYSYYQKLAIILELQGEYDDAQAQLTTLFKRCKAELGDTHSLTIDSGISLGSFWAERHRFQEAQLCFEALLKNSAYLPGSQQMNIARHLVTTYRQLGQLKKAIDTCQKALEQASETQANDSSRVLQLRNILASIYIDLEEWGKADEILTSIKGTPCNAQLSSSIKTNLYILRKIQGRRQEALDLAMEAQRLQSECLGVATSERLVVENNAMRCQIDLLGLTDEVELQIQELMRQRQETHFLNHPLHIALISDIAYAYSLCGNMREAEDLLDKVDALGELSEGDKPVSYATSLGKRATIYVRLGRLAEAEKCERKALSVRQKVFPEGHSLITSTMENLATTLAGLQKYEEAEALLQEVITIHDDHAQRTTDPSGLRRARLRLAWTKKNLAGLLFLQAKAARSLDLFNQALELSLAAEAEPPVVHELWSSIARVNEMLVTLEGIKDDQL
ncbi:serine threonine kinase [Fusarium globosum]|uniref:Serine threonine kinase n=1 Tax=Fusarium globosum TaxID=78864 RepID=A0A8H5XT59_9HYPO|nr:serine threonine kinase [Fusarium globosum]